MNEEAEEAYDRLLNKIHDHPNAEILMHTIDWYEMFLAGWLAHEDAHTTVFTSITTVEVVL